MTSKKNTKTIAIDLGSNTIRFVAYDCQSKSFLWEFEKIVKTADNLHQTKQISPQATQRVIQAIQEAQNLYDFTSRTIVAYTTQAIRVATNQDEVLQTIKQTTGISFEVIDGLTEAMLTLKAIEHRLSILKLPNQEFALIDIGGGSSEITLKYHNTLHTKSFDIGIVTIAQKYKTKDAISQAMSKELQPMRDFVTSIYQKHHKVSTFVATAGTPTTIASMKLGMSYATYDSSRINGVVLHINELDIYLNKLLSMPKTQRELAVGVGRDDLIIAGILIYKEIFDIVGIDECIVIDDGLREGIALEYCEL